MIFSNNSFEPNEPSQGWDGTRDGRSVEQGVYVYYLEYTVNGRKEKTVGSVTLIKQRQNIFFHCLCIVALDGIVVFA
ncbi:MAG: hypothetical protein ACO3MB_13470 [Saprospiraceae bacterium]